MIENNYSTKIVARNYAADQTMLGVRLGRVCIANNVPATVIAKQLNVTKNTIYKWFTGEFNVSKHLADKVKLYLETTPVNSVPQSEYIA